VFRQILNCAHQPRRVVLKRAQTNVATVTQEASYFLGRMAMVNVELLAPHSSIGSPTNRAIITLSSQHVPKVLD